MQAVRQERLAELRAPRSGTAVTEAASPGIMSAVNQAFTGAQTKAKEFASISVEMTKRLLDFGALAEELSSSIGMESFPRLRGAEEEDPETVVKRYLPSNQPTNRRCRTAVRRTDRCRQTNGPAFRRGWALGQGGTQGVGRPGQQPLGPSQEGKGKYAL